MTGSPPSFSPSVVVVGSGPTGLVLAAELALARVDVVVLERRPTATLAGSRAGGFHARTIEVLDQRGVADRFLAEGTTAQAAMLGGTVLDLAGAPTRHPYSLGLWQTHVERILLGWVEELGVPIRRGAEVIGFTQDDGGIDVHLADGTALRTAYLVGADGGRSVVRKAAGISLEGPDATRSTLVAEVEVTEPIPDGIRIDATGVHGLSRTGAGTTVRVVTTEDGIGPAVDPTLDDLSTRLVEVFGTDFGVHSPSWISRFTDATRQAVAYRAGRVLIAGDAAHVHSPAGGQGIGLGVQDAVNLGWKLAQVVHGVSPADLLDTYGAERHPPTARALRQTMAQTVLQKPDERIAALAETIDELLESPDARLRLACRIHGLDVVLDLGQDADDHPLVGRRVPDVDLVTEDGPRRLYELLHTARHVLLDLGGGLDAGVWDDRVRPVAATSDGPWVLPVVGEVTPPTGVLVRPDGHVAWAGQGRPDDGDTLRQALTRWCGPA